MFPRPPNPRTHAGIYIVVPFAAGVQGVIHTFAHTFTHANMTLRFRPQDRTGPGSVAVCEQVRAGVFVLVLSCVSALTVLKKKQQKRETPSMAPCMQFLDRHPLLSPPSFSPFPSPAEPRQSGLKMVCLSLPGTIEIMFQRAFLLSLVHSTLSALSLTLPCLLTRLGKQE